MIWRWRRLYAPCYPPLVTFKSAVRPLVPNVIFSELLPCFWTSLRPLLLPGRP